LNNIISYWISTIIPFWDKKFMFFAQKTSIYTRDYYIAVH
jgi:hypothetical protein